MQDENLDRLVPLMVNISLSCILCSGLFLPIYFLFVFEDINFSEKERKGGKSEDSKRGWKERGRKGKREEEGKRERKKGRKKQRKGEEEGGKEGGGWEGRERS